MSYCKELGKDRIIFVTKEDHQKPSNVTLPEDEDEKNKGLILANGDINWNCPCLGGMASGPCGYQFREAFSCFHYSNADTKGSDCIERFAQMQECMSQFPNLYPNRDDDNEDNEDIEEQQLKQQFSQQLEQELDQKTQTQSVEKTDSDEDQKKT